MDKLSLNIKDVIIFCEVKASQKPNSEKINMAKNIESTLNSDRGRYTLDDYQREIVNVEPLQEGWEATKVGVGGTAAAILPFVAGMSAQKFLVPVEATLTMIQIGAAELCAIGNGLKNTGSFLGVGVVSNLVNLVLNSIVGYNIQKGNLPEEASKYSIIGGAGLVWVSQYLSYLKGMSKQAYEEVGKKLTGIRGKIGNILNRY